jgi:2-phospho-L-lactate transferase/gluconeogenesis factor (CofD/UPF0052 family)
LPPKVLTAIAETSAQRVYVCNLRAELAETKGYDVSDHVDAVVRHGVVPDVVLYQRDGLPGGRDLEGRVECAVAADLSRPNGLAHDDAKLAAVLEMLARARRG